MNNINVITNDMLHRIKNDDEIMNELLNNNDIISFKVKVSDVNVKIIKLGMCFICKRKIEGSEHHIILIENGGSDDNYNKIFLCSECRNNVELNCETCKNNIIQLCNKELFKKCWIDGYPLNIKECDTMTNKNIIQSTKMEQFKCEECKQRLLRVSMWDKENHLSNEWYASFRCTKCNKTYNIKMTKDIMNWVIDNIKVSFI